MSGVHVIRVSVELAALDDALAFVAVSESVLSEWEIESSKLFARSAAR